MNSQSKTALYQDFVQFCSGTSPSVNNNMARRQPQRVKWTACGVLGLVSILGDISVQEKLDGAESETDCV